MLRQDYHLLWCHFSMDLQHCLVSQDINPNRTPVNVTISLPDELFPVRSPLLRDSQLISFPSLTNMLKFRELSRLIQVIFCFNYICAYILVDCFNTKQNYTTTCYPTLNHHIIITIQIRSSKLITNNEVTLLDPNQESSTLHYMMIVQIRSSKLITNNEVTLLDFNQESSTLH